MTAPRPLLRRERNNDFSAVGRVGRRTGITVPQGRRDENGLEEMSGLFSSPQKQSPLQPQINGLGGIGGNSTFEVSGEMTGLDSTGLTPTQVLSTRKSLRRSLPPPRSASPKKTGINGTARRSIAVDLLSATKDMPTADPEDRENTLAVTPTRQIQNVVRRLPSSPYKSPLREVTANGSAASRLAKGKQKGTQMEVLKVLNGRGSNFPDDDEHEQLTEDMERAADDLLREYGGYVHYGAMEDEDEDEDYVPEHEVGTDANHEMDNDRINEGVEFVRNEFALHSIPGKRKSSSLEVDLDAGESSHSPPAKRPRKTSTVKHKPKPTAIGDGNIGAGPSLISPPWARPKDSKPDNATSRAQDPLLSTQQQAELDQIVDRIKARPGQKKSLYILRRETPMDDSITRTRSGRISFKPLAYWRNERCVYGGSPGGTGLEEGARFPLTSIKEIIRMEQVEQAHNGGAPKGKRKAGKRKGRTRPADQDESDPEGEGDSVEFDASAQPWETESGILRGNVAVWDQEKQQPIDALEEIEIAYAPAAIVTREVKSTHPDQRSFRYAKLVNGPFLGCGIVELAPGDLKRPKNSRKMHMCFFVAKGRVTVEVGSLVGQTSRFSIGKGGFWQVPRGNQYSIENELDGPAQIFFSQGSELVS